jgi:hypothetical protein
MVSAVVFEPVVTPLKGTAAALAAVVALAAVTALVAVAALPLMSMAYVPALACDGVKVPEICPKE